MDKELVDKLLELLPPTVLAAGLIRACGNFAKERPELAQRLLANTWLDIAPGLHEALKQKPTGKFAASALLIEQYFMCSGDWKKMEHELTEHAPVSPELVERVVQVISSGLTHASRSM